LDQFRAVQAAAQTLGQVQRRLEAELDSRVGDLGLLRRSVLVLLQVDALLDRLMTYRGVVLVVNFLQQFLVQQNFIEFLI